MRFSRIRDTYYNQDHISTVAITRDPALRIEYVTLTMLDGLEHEIYPEPGHTVQELMAHVLNRLEATSA